MKNNRSNLSLFVSGVVILLAIYLCLAYWYVGVAEKKNIEKVQEHTVVIASDLWSLNTSGMFAYLELVAKTDYYKTLDIRLDEETVFLSIKGPVKGAMDTLLHRLGIVTEKNIIHPIVYNGSEIGQLEGVVYIRYVYPLFYIFLSVFFSAITLAFIFYLVFSRRILEKQVRERTRKYLDFVNLLPEMVIETDAAGAITFANRRATDCFGFSDFAKLKQNCSDYLLFENEKGVTLSFFLNTERSEFENMEYRAKGASGTLFPVLIRFAPVFNDNKFTGARMVIVDVTEHKDLIKQLNLDQKMKSIGMMASGIAHDLNNILSGIINYPELLLRQLPPESPLVKQIIPMKNAGLQAAAVVADLLTVARGVAATKKTVGFNDVINEYVESAEFQELQKNHTGVRYRFDLSAELQYVLCSVTHVRKSLMNLINNSSEAIDGVGEITVSTKNVQLDSPMPTRYGEVRAGSYVVLSVQDSGKGIPANVIEHIFEPFFSKKELGRSGTGLGLVVVLNTVQDHNGGINVISSEKGSTFDLYFPVSSEKEAVKAPDEDIDQLRGRGQSILVVDDEPRQRDIATQLLESLGYEVASVASGRAALDYLHQKSADLILLDMIMEPDMNGLMTYEEIIKIYPRQHAIIVSGFSENADVKKALQVGVGGLINKPYTGEQLARVVYDELNKQQ